MYVLCSLIHSRNNKTYQSNWYFVYNGVLKEGQIELRNKMDLNCHICHKTDGSIQFYVDCKRLHAVTNKVHTYML